MKVLIAPNSMKGSLNAFKFADTVEQAFRKCSPSFELRKVPVADGGDLTGKVLSEALGAEKVEVKVLDPLGRKIQSEYSISGKTAIIEMADASGIKRMKPEELNPMNASSYGTGQLMKHAVDFGCNEILLGVGGSATVDGGSGMLEALGFKFFDSYGKILSGNGGNLEDISKVEKPVKLNKISIKIISDVDNPLLGENGAAKVFGPQKGADARMVEKLENGLKNWAELLERESGQKFSDSKGTGAAGGIALPLVTFFNAEIVPGAAFVLAKLDFQEHLKWADLVITGEGKIDTQTLNNKAPVVVAQFARKMKKPVVAIGANVDYKASNAFDAVFSIINRPLSLEDSVSNSENLIFGFSYELARLLNKLEKSP